ncbi:acyl-CoA dehydrogenase family protein [Loktanella sp. M215]|uniref:acyl-CoA dehydrogenase family protein n=1 Tax=Loktanella sp. M215 TaxID=2675431 RepID=UPI001F2915AD|nr:acyl-CoA dehydrogenase family protein [Loktanella sp. M215]MCF7701785.1 hypothetical protein [Loktanella sp. M215]
MTMGFFPDEDEVMLAEAALRAFASAAPAEESVDTLDCLRPISAGIDLVAACVLVREAGRQSLGYPLAEAFVLATLQEDGGSAADLRASFGSLKADGAVTGPVPVGVRQMIVPAAGLTHLYPVDRVGKASDPLQASGWICSANMEARTIATDLRSIAWTLVAARMLGAAEALLKRAVDHLSHRKQFGRPLGSFQTLRHRAAEDWIRVEDMRAAVDLAATAFDASDKDASLSLARIAKATASAAAPLVAENVIHAHGAMGFTWDAELHPYLVAIRRDAASLGTASSLFRDIGAERIQQTIQQDITP